MTKADPLFLSTYIPPTPHQQITTTLTLCPNVPLSFCMKDIHSIKSKEFFKKKETKKQKPNTKRAVLGQQYHQPLAQRPAHSLGSECGGCLAPGSSSAEVLKGPSTAWHPFSFWLVGAVGAGTVQMGGRAQGEVHLQLELGP